MMIDLDHPIYRPLWARLLIVGVCLGWAGFEFWGGAPFWGVIVGGLGIYAAYKLFYEFYRRQIVDPRVEVSQDERQ
jgi:hypothetical protein